MMQGRDRRQPVPSDSGMSQRRPPGLDATGHQASTASAAV